MESIKQGISGNNDWCANWFGSKYYSILYKHRNEEEAQLFINNIVAYLKLEPGSEVWDMACGNGRHANMLQKAGYNVLASDIVLPPNIKVNQPHENICFTYHDMRLPMAEKKFAAIFNLFTSFGYFDTEAESKQVFKNVSKSLKPKGFFILDFFNTNWVKNNLIPYEVKTIDGISFHLKKRIEDNYIIKNISFIHEGKEYNFFEKVRLFLESDLKSLATENGLIHMNSFGSYNLHPFDFDSSQRLIMVFQKN